MDFALFILLNAVLFVRPEELLPELAGSRLYLIVMAVCLLVSARRLVDVLSPSALATNPIGVCVLGMLIAVPLSNAARGDLDQASDDFGEFGKVVLYYFLMVATVNTPSRLRSFIGWCVPLILGLVAFAQLQYHGYIDIEHMEPVRQREIDPESGEEVWSLRICSTGIFNDPNDLCLVLGFGMLCCLYRTLSGGTGRWLWLVPTVPFAYTLVLTQSRGGMLGLLTGVGGFLVARFGGRRAVPLVAVCLPAVLLAIGGRQANIGLGKGDTSNERVMLWAEGLTELLNRPSSLLTGIGAREHATEFGLVAHNSYIHAFVELGLLGGTAFLAAFYWSFVSLRAAKPGPRLTDATARSLWPIVAGMLAAYAAGIYTISRNYVIPTYMILGLVTCYVQVTLPTPPPRCTVTTDWVRRTAMIGAIGFAGLKLFTQVAGHVSS